jgi:adenylosuccinate synthase
MSVWVVVGGQFGSEGKGKVSAILALREDIDICVRCGGPNSGHSFVSDDGRSKLVRQVPTGFVSPRSRLLIPAGGLVDPDVLKSEVELLGLTPDRIGVDRSAMVIRTADKHAERALELDVQLSSTLCE